MNAIVKILSLPLGIIVWSWVTFVMWAWFAPVVSPLLPIMSFAQCVALRALLAPLRSGVSDSKPEITEDEKTRAAMSAAGGVTLVPLLVLLIGWIIHMFVHLPAEVKS